MNDNDDSEPQPGSADARGDIESEETSTQAEPTQQAPVWQSPPPTQQAPVWQPYYYQAPQYNQIPQYNQAPQYYQQPYPQQPKQRALLPYALIALAMVLVAGAIGVVIVIRQKGDDPGQPVAGQLRSTFPTEPSVGWTVDVDDVMRGYRFVRPDPTSTRYESAGFIDLGDALVTSAWPAQETDDEPVMVAIDAQSGDVLWTTSVGYRPVCASAPLDGLLPCLGYESPDTDSAASSMANVSFVRLSDGEIDHTLDAPVMTQVEVHDSALYTFGWQRDTGPVVSRGTAEDLKADWSEAITIDSYDAYDCPGSGDAVLYGATDDFVYVGSDIGVAVLRADSGELLGQGVQGADYYDGQGFLGRLCDTGGSTIQTETVIFDRDGQALSTIEADLDVAVWPASNWLVASSADQPYVIGRTAYEFGTGDPLWTAEGESQVNRLSTVVGDTVLGGGYSDYDTGQPLPLAAFDMATGENLWSTDIEGNLSMSDGQRVLVVHNEAMTAVNLSTGEQEWTMSAANPYGFDVAGQGFAHSTDEEIAYYAPTGGPSVAPGRVGDSSTRADDEQPSSGLITKCGKTPEMRPVEYRTEDGSLVVTMEIKASCPGGDIVSTDALNISISDDEGAIAAGVFDFSNDPLYLPGDSGSGDNAVEQQFSFGLGNFWRLPNSLGQPGSGSSAGNGPVAASGDQLVECTDEGTSAGPTSADNPPGSGQDKSRVATGSGAMSADPEKTALDALRAQADADKPFILSDLAERWVPQVSSKYPGLTAVDVDGVTMVHWTAQEILNQHLRLRMKYPEVRLLWSDEWSSFDIRGWWVTVAGLAFSGSDAANAWCDSNGIPVNECFAKLVSNTRGPEGTTDYRS